MVNVIKYFNFSVLTALIMAIGMPMFGNIAMASGPQLSRDLSFGMTGADVQALQQFLNTNGYTVATSGAGAPGHETIYYGALTQNAVSRFQAANGLPQTGICDSATRAKIANWSSSSIQAMIETLKARIAELQKQLAAILAEGETSGNGPNIIALKVADGGDEGVIDTKDTITITFDKEIDPESINDELDKGDMVTGVDADETGGVSVSSSGKVTIKNIAYFDMGSVDDSGDFEVKLSLNSTGKILTITLTSGDDIDISNEDFGIVTQIGGTVKDKNGNKMKTEEGVTNATGTFGGEGSSDSSGRPYITAIEVENGGDDGYIDVGDKIKITFSKKIDPESINSGLTEGGSVNNVSYTKTGGVSVSSVGRVMIKNIAAFTAGEVTKSGNFNVKLSLNSTGKILTNYFNFGNCNSA